MKESYYPNHASQDPKEVLSETCPTCDGGGTTSLMMDCPDCKGTGRRIRYRFEPASGNQFDQERDSVVPDMVKANTQILEARIAELQRERDEFAERLTLATLECDRWKTYAEWSDKGKFAESFRQTAESLDACEARARKGQEMLEECWELLRAFARSLKESGSVDLRDLTMALLDRQCPGWRR